MSSPAVVIYNECLMQLQTLSLIQFRNMAEATFEFHPQLTILLGDNGVGKTNVLEAASLLSFPRSFRGSKDDELIQWQSEFARIEGQVLLDRDIHRQFVVFINGGKKLQIDGQAQPAHQFVGQFLSVMFAPEEVSILSGPPARRRALLDAHLSQLSSAYFSLLLQYNQVLRRRNRLLAVRADVNQLRYWNDQMVDLGSRLITSRLAGIERLNNLLSPALRLDYQSSLIGHNQPTEAYFQQKQASIYERELAVGHSLIGPQRDDWCLVEVAGSVRNLGQFGSRGEQRMGVVALKRAQLADVEQQTGFGSVLLLDDVLSELDAEHQQELVRSLGQQQTILSTASLTDIPESLLEQSWIYQHIDGTWRQAKR